MLLNPPNPWDIWMAEVSYEENPNRFKTRPVIILEQDEECTDENAWLAIYITSQVAKYRNRNDSVILEWQKEGLDKPSIALCAEILQLYETDLQRTRPIGYCSAYDINRIEDILDKLGI